MVNINKNKVYFCDTVVAASHIATERDFECPHLGITEVKRSMNQVGVIHLNGMNYRYYYDKCFDFILQEELRHLDLYRATRSAKQRQRMYANLFCRDMRKQLISNKSICCYCGSSERLVVDHIIPITKGGQNTIENTQILCCSCNSIKSNRL